jgi:aspartate oxidase
MIVQESSSESDIDDASLALMVRKTTKMLKKLNKSGIKFDARRRNSLLVAKESPYSR